MKALRILLQLVILGAGGVTLAALISRPNPDITSILVFLGFLAFLLAFDSGTQGAHRRALGAGA